VFADSPKARCNASAFTPPLEAIAPELTALVADQMP
jgi:hypothetical protein